MPYTIMAFTCGNFLDFGVLRVGESHPNFRIVLPSDGSHVFWHVNQSVFFSVVGGMLPVKLASPINRTGA
eukprot:scaffold14257_cov71-Skeletonema_dohrnii-CCMP3373.AAC.1